ncbi:F-box/kelch-repeat protein [Camellia lanceoleosa]|uniref:F-box/kelch-repeat protein n=1 Tax=Camellia lanceoleosa TaxID=1840588 RepID=A0ACC0H7S8_9ERIC|nr:F-box/kelch-repeat protein [Camellia lanceoleosa]
MSGMQKYFKLGLMSASMSLPMEIMLEIFARLPVQTLGCCRCVCKSWHSLVAEPFFINKHLLHRSISDRDNGSSSHVILQCGHRKSRSFFYYSLCCLETLAETKRYQFPDLTKYGKYFSRFRLVGSSNGLLCLLDLNIVLPDTFCDVVLWNPSIGKFKMLPTSQIESRPVDKALGFGFVPHINDYKVVRLVYRLESIQPEVEVYSLSTDSWRKMTTNFKDCRVFHPSSSPLVNGAVHWKAYNWGRGSESSDRQQWFIMSFHMMDEIFQEISLPVAINFGAGSILAFRDSLAFFTCSDIWVMTDYGVVDSWTKQYSLRDAIEFSFGLMSNGEVLLIKSNSNLVYYDLKIHEHRKLKGQPFARVHGMFIYKESLALLNEGEAINIQSDQVAEVRA